MQAILQLTITSVISMLLFSLCFAALLDVILKFDKLLCKIRYELLFVCMIVPIIKMIIPMEVLPWTHNITVPYILPEAVRFMNKEIIIAGTKITLWSLVLGVLALGALVNAVRVIYSYGRFKQYVKMLPNVEDSDIYELVEKILAEKGKKASIILKWIGKEKSAKIGGFLQPYILMPNREYSGAQLESILRHEIAHYVKGDMLIRLGWIIIKIICWWNPAIYMLDMQFEKLLEIRADENAIKDVHNDVSCDYMETLINAAKETNKEEGAEYCISFLKEEGISLKRRVKLMLDREEKTRSSFFLINFVSTACIIALTIAMNVFIFEPRGKLPEVENFVGSKVVTSSEYFLVRNADGTFNMYMNGTYCATVREDGRSNMSVYESLEEALRYEEIK